MPHLQLQPGVPHVGRKSSIYAPTSPQKSTSSQTEDQGNCCFMLWGLVELKGERRTPQ